MIASMTGYGRGEAAVDGVAAAVELRSVNSRFLEVTARLPRSLSIRENEIKEILRKHLSRGKVTLSVSVERGAEVEAARAVNIQAASDYILLLPKWMRTLNLR